MKQIKKQESGRSMVEMVGVLAIMGLITAGAFVLLSSGYASQKRSRATDEIDVIASNVRAMAAQALKKDVKFATLPAPDDDGKAKGLPQAFLDSEDGATPFGGIYMVYTKDEGQTFTIALADISEKECSAMASRAYSKGTGECTGTTVEITFSE